MLVVTGASGLLGASLLTRAQSLGRAVTGLCHRHEITIPGLRIHAVDLTDPAAIRQALTPLHPAQIIHCAAATNVDWCEEHSGEAEAINCHAAAHLSELALELGSRFVYISTDAVFDGQRGGYSETDKPAPLNAYAKSKLRGEQEVFARNPAAVIARVNIYGWNAQDKLSLAEWVLEKLAAGKPVPGFTDIHFTPILVNDLSDLLLRMLDCGMSGLYHVGGAEKISKFEFARRVAAAFSFDPSQVVPARVAEVGLRAKRPPDISLNTEKIRAALGQSMPDVESGLRRFRALRDQGYPQLLKSYLNGIRK